MFYIEEKEKGYSKMSMEVIAWPDHILICIDQHINNDLQEVLCIVGMHVGVLHNDLTDIAV